MAATAETVALTAFKAPNNSVVLDMEQIIVHFVDRFMVNHQNSTLYVLPGDVEVVTTLLAERGLPHKGEAVRVPGLEWSMGDDLVPMIGPEDYDGE
jgi:hypothetical protein